MAAAESGTVICGNPDDCIKAVRKYADAGVDGRLLLCQVRQIPYAAIMDTIKMFGRYVIPYFKNVDQSAPQLAAAAAL